MYDRVKQWRLFSEQVEKHIIQYTLPQYGNKEGTEQVEEFTVEDCYKNLLRYVNRRNTSVRGNTERLRDVVKIAHYINFIYDKLKVEINEEDIYA